MDAMISGTLAAIVTIGATVFTAVVLTFVSRQMIRDLRFDISARKTNEAVLLDQVRRADASREYEHSRAVEWRAMAVDQAKRVRELTDRLLIKAGVPSLDPGGEEPPTVGAADRMAAEQARIRAHTSISAGKTTPVKYYEPLTVADDAVPPVRRLSAEDSDGEEDTSFKTRMGG